jgi:thymidylate synthase
MSTNWSYLQTLAIDIIVKVSKKIKRNTYSKTKIAGAWD